MYKIKNTRLISESRISIYTKYFIVPQVPANRLGFRDSGGPFDIMQLKVIQEVITLAVFTVFSMIAFKMELRWNHLAAFVCLILAVYFVFRK